MKYFSYLSFLFLSIVSRAQKNNYPQNYFRNPLNIPILLAGNFGECRPGHFHSGIDIKTKGKENLPVYAAADGYISRIKLEPGGFGHAIYITHANGYTTLYAHLNNFFPALQKRVHQTQYKQENWEVDLTFQPNEYPVKQSQQIAWSGNTGGSTAPHLHFEIRDTKTEHPLNPLLFGIKIIDSIAPVISEIAIYDAHESIYEQEPQFLKIKKNGNKPIKAIDTIICSSTSIFLGVAVNDFMNTSENTLSFYTAQWYAQNELQGNLVMDDIGYDETRYLNACADYKTKQNRGIWFNSLFLLPNNKLTKIYTHLKTKSGAIDLVENGYTHIQIKLADVNENESLIEFVIQQKGISEQKRCEKRWKAGTNYTLEFPNLKFNLEASSLYDDICIDVSRDPNTNTESDKIVSANFKIHKAEVPVHKYFDLNLKADMPIPFSLMDKIALRYTDGNIKSGKAAKINNGWFTASVRNFGNYWLVIDTTAPIIKPLIKSGASLGSRKELKFTITDNCTSVKMLKGSIDGHWLCFERHENNWVYHIDEHCPKGKSKLELIAVDENGNERKMDYYFTR
jgi:murein DD-endopeptidase MepM/ murein hydrolase activator NlpD